MRCSARARCMRQCAGPSGIRGGRSGRLRGCDVERGTCLKSIRSVASVSTIRLSTMTRSGSTSISGSGSGRADRCWPVGACVSDDVTTWPFGPYTVFVTLCDSRSLSSPCTQCHAQRCFELLALLACKGNANPQCMCIIRAAVNGGPLAHARLCRLRSLAHAHAHVRARTHARTHTHRHTHRHTHTHSHTITHTHTHTLHTHSHAPSALTFRFSSLATSRSSSLASRFCIGSRNLGLHVPTGTVPSAGERSARASGGAEAAHHVLIMSSISTARILARKFPCASRPHDGTPSTRIR
jgi:hypothetical protein